MPDPKRPLLQDLSLRAGGVFLLAAGVGAMNFLYQMVHTSPRHEATLAELALAAIGFLSLSAGSILMALGRHIFDRVEVSARWAAPLPTKSGLTAHCSDRGPAPGAPISNHKDAQ